MNQAVQQAFRIGHWAVQPQAGQLTCGWFKKTEKRIEPKAMQVLIALAEKPGQFRSKDDLLESVWAGRTVGEDCLTGAIHTLRQALGDNPRSPQYIETRNNVGYRLIAPISNARPTRSVAFVALLALTAVSTWFVYSKVSTHPIENDIRTVAVLPFSNLSGSTSDEFFAAAMTDSLISDLARRPGVRVISRTSVMPFYDHNESADEIARQLGADVLVEGSVQTESGHARVSARLIDPYIDEHLWASQYDRGVENIFELQSEISNSIANEINTIVGTPENSPGPQLTLGQSRDYLQSRFELEQEKVATVQAALQGFSELTDARPEFALAHLGRAEALLFLFKARAADVNALERAAIAANRYESLAGASVASHRCIGQIHLLLNWDFATAEDRYRKAILSNPSDTVARSRYAWLLVGLARYEEARTEIDLLRVLDPLYYNNAGLATLLLYAGAVDDAIAEFERVDASARQSKAVLRTMATAYLSAGRQDDARKTLVKMMKVSGVSSPEMLHSMEFMEITDLYRHILEAQLFDSRIVSAGFHALLGETEGALSNLENAVATRDPFALFVGALPELAALHRHPRFKDILKTMGIEGINQRLTSIPKQSSSNNN